MYNFCQSKKSPRCCISQASAALLVSRTETARIREERSKLSTELDAAASKLTVGSSTISRLEEVRSLVASL